MNKTPFSFVLQPNGQCLSLTLCYFELFLAFVAENHDKICYCY